MHRTRGAATDRLRFVAVALAGLCWVAAGVASAQFDESSAETGGLAAVPVPEGWQPAGQVHRFGPDNLWDYINGADALFLDYGCLELLVQDVERGDLALSISVYDHGTPLNAFGIFRRDGGASGQAVDGAGAAAVAQPPYRGLLLKGRFYVKLDAGAGALDHTALAALLTDLASQLPGTDDLPAELSWLPITQRQPGSLGFTRRDFLGLAELRDAVHATYEDPGGGSVYQLFCLVTDTPAQAAFGPRWQTEDLDGEQLHWRPVPYRGLVAMRGVPGGGPLIGVAGVDDLDRARALLDEVIGSEGSS